MQWFREESLRWKMQKSHISQVKKQNTRCKKIPQWSHACELWNSRKWLRVCYENPCLKSTWNQILTQFTSLKPKEKFWLRNISSKCNNLLCLWNNYSSDITSLFSIPPNTWYTVVLVHKSSFHGPVNKWKKSNLHLTFLLVMLHHKVNRLKISLHVDFKEAHTHTLYDCMLLYATHTCGWSGKHHDKEKV